MIRTLIAVIVGLVVAQAAQGQPMTWRELIDASPAATASDLKLLNVPACPIALGLSDSLVLRGDSVGAGSIQMWYKTAIRWTALPPVANGDTLTVRVLKVTCSHGIPAYIYLEHRQRFWRVDLSEVPMFSKAGVVGRDAKGAGAFTRDSLGRLSRQVVLSLGGQFRFITEVAARDSLTRWSNLSDRAYQTEIAADDSVSAARERRLEALRKDKRREALRRKGWSAGVIEKIVANTVAIGMTADQVIESWGQPDQRNRTILEGLVTEQWVYGSVQQYVYLRNGRVNALQESK